MDFLQEIWLLHFLYTSAYLHCPKQYLEEYFILWEIFTLNTELCVTLCMQDVTGSVAITCGPRITYESGGWERR